MSCKKNTMEGVSQNCIFNDYQNNKSTKMIQAEMLRNRTKISYKNSRVTNIYRTILNKNYDENLKLSKLIGLEAYRIYWRQISTSRISEATRNKVNEYFKIAYPE